MRLGTFTASIIVDGKALEEFDVVSESPTKAICWVASEEGKPFSVQWKCHEESRVAAAQGCVYVDGIGCGGIKTMPGPSGVGDTSTLSCLVRSTSTRDLIFSRVQLSDDDSLLNKEVSKNLGEISLVIERGKAVQQYRSGSSSAHNKDPPVSGGNEKLHERSKKATVHCVGFGPEKARTFSNSPYKWRIICDNQPQITFVFKYQPLAVLQANGIAPRPTSTDSGTRHENSSSILDVRAPGGDVHKDIKPAQLHDRIQSLENELKRLRDLQSNDSEDQKLKRIKTEDSGKRRRLFSPGEIIDLT